MAVLKDLTIAVTGTHEHDIARIKRWIDANGGRYSPHVRSGVTHLITGKDAWKQSSDAVQAANKLGVFVVTFEWLEDSLHKRRKLAEKQYTWEHIAQLKRIRSQMKKLGPQASKKQFNDGCEEIERITGSDWHVPFVPAAEALKRKRDKRDAAKAKKEAQEAAAKKTKESNTDHAASNAPSSSTAELISSSTCASSHALSTTSFQLVSPTPEVEAKKTSLKDLYHYYLDSTGFEYKIILTRCNLRANEITRYRLSLLESHTKPYVYCTLIEYFPPGAGCKASSGEACIEALLGFEKNFHEGAAPSIDVDAAPNDIQEDKTDVLPASLPPPHQDVHYHPEAERLRALLASPSVSTVSPSADKVYKNLIAPMSSDFVTAWRIFRHAFRDLTLLSWEERFDISKILYKARASHFAIEPFVYLRPKQGLPLGLRVQQDGLFQNQTLAPLSGDGSILSHHSPENAIRENDDGYVYNTFNLPSLNVPLGPGIIGQAVSRDIKAAHEAAEEAKKLADEAEEVRLRKLGLARKLDGKKKPNYSRPLFNGVNGRPTTDAWGKQKSGKGNMGGLYGSGLLGGDVEKQRRPFPSERKESW